MDYKKHYSTLIERAKTRILNSYTEKHHIVPRCMGGSDDPNNLVRLTPEEHYVAHQLLVKIYPSNHRLINAATMMVANRNTNKMYGWLRRRLQSTQKINQAAENNSSFGTKWICKNGATLKINKTELEEYLKLGWHSGRVEKKAQRKTKQNVCKQCNKFFTSVKSVFCSDECRRQGKPNIVRDNFDKIYPLYLKYQALAPALIECKIGITKSVYDRFYKLVEEKYAGVA